MTQINNLKDLTEKKIYPVNTQLRKRNRNHIVLPELKNTKDTYNCFNKKKNVISEIKIDNKLKNLLFSIGKLVLIYLIFHASGYLLEQFLAKKIKELFNTIINRILNYDINFYKKYTTNDINLIWTYLNTIE